MESARLSEVSTDASGDTYTTRWMIDPPAKGVSFVVVRAHWEDDYRVRVIEEIRFV